MLFVISHSILPNKSYKKGKRIPSANYSFVAFAIFLIFIRGFLTYVLIDFISVLDDSTKIMLKMLF